MTKAELFKKALLDSTMKEIRAIEEADYPTIEMPKKYDLEIYNAINNSSIRVKRYPKRAAIILAAILICLTMMMSISAIRVRIIDFVVNIYEKYICLSVEEPSENYPKRIEKIYKPSYVPNSYVENIFDKQPITIRIEWKYQNNTIKFYQHIMTDEYIRFDNKNSGYSTTQLEELKIYYLVKDEMYTVRWLSNGYSFTLFCPESLGWNEIEKIILSIEEVPVDN